jgi:2,5-furandicarboxylate decarboxylase 2
MPGGSHLVLAITGATGVLYGVRILQQLGRQPEWTSHVSSPRRAA